jgi:hypothetical protein
MSAPQGAPPRPNAPALPGFRLRTLRLRTWVRSAVVLWTAGALLAGASLTGCEYTYDDGWRPAQDVTAAPAVTAAGPSSDYWRRDPVGEAGLNAWLERSQMGEGLDTVHRGYGLLQAQEVHNGTTAALPAGTYLMALLCRSQRRVSFTVSTDDVTVVDLSLRCGARREEVVYLSAESALIFRVEARSAANFAYRITPL